MATKPTKQQRQACDQLTEALVLITEAARLDERGMPARLRPSEQIDRLSLIVRTQVIESVPVSFAPSV